MFDTKKAENVWDKRIKELFNSTEKSVEDEKSDILWSIINLILYESAKSTELMEVYQVLGRMEFIKLIQVLDGRELQPPSKKDFQEVLLTAVFYYEKEVNGKSWKEIQDSIDFDISPRKYGIKVRNVSNFIQQKIQEILRKGE